jgi:uncharacterized membrane protein YeaQ/YmgE (transglycosylase-associated protein family)
MLLLTICFPKRANGPCAVTTVVFHAGSREKLKMDYFYWVLIGVLIALVAKVQLPTDRDENIIGLLTMGILGAVGAGAIAHVAAGSGFMSASWVGHVAAFLGAVGLVLGMRVATKQHLA